MACILDDGYYCNSYLTGARRAYFYGILLQKLFVLGHNFLISVRLAALNDYRINTKITPVKYFDLINYE